MNSKTIREKKTLLVMIRIYCRANHGSGKTLCSQCDELHNYAIKKIDNCKMGDLKTTCAQCSIHCFKPEYRKMIKKVMRYSGPRMIFKHPVLAIYHLIDARAGKKM